MTYPASVFVARRRRAPRLILSLLALAVVTLAWAASARAGTFTVSGCPGGSGWSQVPATTNYVSYTQPCTGGSTAGPRIALGPDQNPPEGFAPNVDSGVVFAVPAGMTISSYTLDLSAYGGPCAIASNQCASGEGYVWATHSGQGGTIYDFNDLGQGAENAVINPSGLVGVTSVMIGVGCDPGPGGYWCPGSNGGPNGAEASAQLSSASFQVTSGATPTASGFGGTLLQANAHGTATLLFSAADPGGPGVYTVAVLIDHKTVYGPLTPDTNGGACAASGRDAASGTLIFSSLAPCPVTASVDVPIDTTSLADGQHELQVQVTDAAGNASTVLDQSITTDNLTTVSGLLESPSTASPPKVTPAPSPSPSPAAPVAPSYAATLDAPTVKLAHGITRAYSRSALTLAGTLHNSSGTAAPGVTIILTARAAGSTAAAATLAQTTTNASGEWALHAPPGLSRTLKVVYGNPAKATTASTLVSVHEAVAPTLTLHITSQHGVLHFSGRILPADIKPAPALEVEVKGPATIQTVGLPTYPAADGTYDIIFAIRHADIGYTFTFRAIILSRSYQYTPTRSPWQQAVVH